MEKKGGINNTYLIDRQGFALIAVLIVISIMALIFFGKSYFFRGEKQSGGVVHQVEVLNNAKEDIGSIQKQLNSRTNKQLEEN